MTPWRDTSIGRLRMSDEASTTSGRSPVSGVTGHCVPAIVLFDVTWTYAARGEKSIPPGAGTRRNPSGSVVAATRTAPNFSASLAACAAQEPVTT